MKGSQCIVPHREGFEAGRQKIGANDCELDQQKGGKTTYVFVNPGRKKYKKVDSPNLPFIEKERMRSLIDAE